MVPVALPERCLLSLDGAVGTCRVSEAFWRDRLTGPRHPLLVVRCRTHGVAFTLYPPGYVPYGRVPVVCRVDDGSDVDRTGSLLGAALAASGGESWPEELIDDEVGPVQRTQRRRVQRIAEAVGLDEPMVSSAVLAELGLDAVACTGAIACKVAVLGRAAGDPTLWLRIIGAIDLVGRYGRVGLIDGLRSSHLVPARGSFVRALRGPPR